MAQTTMDMPTQDTATDWLSTLEEKVRAAAERIRTLQREKKQLEGRVSDLEQQLAAAQATQAAQGEPDAGAAHWEEERREIRERVERLTRHLEELAEV